ncbi:MAG TPA: hypothetical protein VGC52_10255 [Gemmatimonadaceae bacterium]
MKHSVCWSALALVSLCGCTPSESPPTLEAATLVAGKADSTDADASARAAAIAHLFADADWTSQCPNDTTCVYVQTFGWGATREITLQVSPNRKYARRSRDIPAATGRAPIYDFKYASDFDADPATLSLNYYVSKEGLPPVNPRAAQIDAVSGDRRTPRVARFASSTREADSRNRHARLAAAMATEGAGINWTEVGKKGTDAAIGAAVEKGGDMGLKGMGKLGTIYSVASVVNDIGAAADLGSQNTKWLAELDALEKCAANPSNQLTRKDPNYSSRTVRMIQKSRSELKEVNAVRYLNQMTEKGADLNKVTAVLAIGLKAGFAWSEQTLADYSENTIMREARVAVVRCDDAADAKGNMSYIYDCTMGNTHELTTVEASVTWEWKVGVLYLPKGSYKFKHVRTVGGQCVETKTAQGRLEGTGNLAVFNNREIEREKGFGYEGRFVNFPMQVTTTNTCGEKEYRNYTAAADFNGLPVFRGTPSAGGQLKGSTPGQSCAGRPGATLTWDFAIPPAK